ncbi:MAG TPA: RDD family protein [Candidatus Limnocylindria bacterium]|nr:RDD family protein [Candidatus Limnocylindria bacterium]
MTDADPPAEEAQAPVADFATRALAWLIDLAALWIAFTFLNTQLASVFFNLAFGDVGLLRSQTDSVVVYVWQTLAVGIAFGLVGLFLMAVSLRTLMGTPGQTILGLLTADSESGTGLGWPQAIGRSAMLYGPWVVVLAVPTYLADQFAGALGADIDWVYVLPWVVRVAAIAWFAFLVVTVRNDPDGRGFHDLASRSMVVEDQG